MRADGCSKSLGANQNTINLGSQLMFLVVVALKIPQRICTQKRNV